MYITKSAKCKCGKVHNLTEMDERHDGKSVICEQCGATYQVAVQTMVHLLDDKGKHLKHVD